MVEVIATDVVGGLTVVAGLVVFALLLRLDQARKASKSVSAPVPAAHRLDPGSDWGKIMDVSLTELTERPDLHTIQAGAAMQIDAAEHAFNRLLADCARVTGPIVAPSFEPARQLEQAPAKPPQQQPLAA